MKLIFICGLPASGKLTVARELAAVTGYTLDTGVHTPAQAATAIAQTLNLDPRESA